MYQVMQRDKVIPTYWPFPNAPNMTSPTARHLNSDKSLRSTTQGGDDLTPTLPHPTPAPPTMTRVGEYGGQMTSLDHCRR